MLSESRPKIDNATLIREIALTDAETAAQLCAELGYPVEADSMRERIRELSATKDRVVYVACVSNAVVGWIEVSIVRHLSSGASGEIGGLVVSSEYRGGGIGRQLIAQAEQWAAAKALTRMVVRSRITREAAHRFYLREGYSIMKTSAVFSKQLTA